MVLVRLSPYCCSRVVCLVSGPIAVEAADELMEETGGQMSQPQNTTRCSSTRRDARTGRRL